MNLPIAAALGLSRHETFSRAVPCDPRNHPVQYRKAQRKYRAHDRIDKRRMLSLMRRDEAVWRNKTGIDSCYNRRFDRCQKPLTACEWKWITNAATNSKYEVVRLEAGLLLDWNGR